MSISEMQACLARLYTDDSFRKLFDLDDAATLQEYRLTEDESAAIRHIDRRMLNFFARSLGHKRKEKILRAYPLLFGLKKSAVERYYLRFCQLYRAGTGRRPIEDISAFGVFMEESLACGDDDLPPYAAELTRFERLRYLSHLTPAPKDEFKVRDEDGALEQSPVAGMDARPLLREGVEVSVFKYNIPEIEERSRRSPPADVGEPTAGEYPVVFLKGANAQGPKMFSLSIAAKLVLDLCDGKRTVSEIILEMEAAFNAPDLKDDVTDSLDRLLSIGVIRV